MKLTKRSKYLRPMQASNLNSISPSMLVNIFPLALFRHSSFFHPFLHFTMNPMHQLIEWTALAEVPFEIIREYRTMIPWGRTEQEMVDWIVDALNLATYGDVVALVNRTSPSWLNYPSNANRTPC
jgi:hypothetical protein